MAFRYDQARHQTLALLLRAWRGKSPRSGRRARGRHMNDERAKYRVVGATKWRIWLTLARGEGLCQFITRYPP